MMRSGQVSRQAVDVKATEALLKQAHKCDLKSSVKKTGKQINQGPWQETR